MKLRSLLLIMFLLNAFAISAYAQTTLHEIISTKPNPEKKLLIVEASCGQCHFGLPGKGCNLAVRIDSIAYFVDGTDIDSHGDSHAKDGFCESIRTAEVQGELINNRFQVSYFKLLKKSGNKKVN